MSWRLSMDGPDGQARPMIISDPPGDKLSRPSPGLQLVQSDADARAWWVVVVAMVTDDAQWPAAAAATWCNWGQPPATHQCPVIHGSYTISHCSIPHCLQSIASYRRDGVCRPTLKTTSAYSVHDATDRNYAPYYIRSLYCLVVGKIWDHLIGQNDA